VLLLAGLGAAVLAGCSASDVSAPVPTATATATPTPSPTPSPTPRTCRVGARLGPGSVVSVIGDSYTTGGGADRWPDVLARRTGLTFLVDGAGYMIGGFTGKDFTGPRFPDQVKRLAPQRPDLVVIMGSRNDINHTDGPYPRVVADTLQAVRRAVPTTPLLVIGSYWVDAHAPESLRYIHDVLRSATSKVTCSSFVDPVEEGWFDRPEGLIGGDGEHPTAAGLKRVADLVQRDLTRLGYLG
jgi:acyl-CoA thioesterase-1